MIGPSNGVRDRRRDRRIHRKDKVVHYAERSRLTRRRSSSAAQFDHGQMLPAFDVANREPKPVAPGTTATNSVRPFRSRLESSLPCRSTFVDFARRFPAESHVWPQRVVPGRVQTNLASHRRQRRWNEQAPHAFVLHRSDEAFDDCDACRFADGSVARPDASSLAPAFETAAPELHCPCPSRRTQVLARVLRMARSRKL